MKTMLCLLTFAVSGGCHSTRQRIYDQGYWQGASDAIKRQYWTQQSRERKAERTKTRYYRFSLAEQTDDGRKLTPEQGELEVQE